MMAWGDWGSPDNNQSPEPQPEPPQPAYQPPNLQGALGGVLANNPVTTSQGSANQPQNPEWQTPSETPGVTQPGTMLGQLQAERYNPADPLAGNVAPDAAQKLGLAAATAAPMLAFGAPSATAGMGLQSAASSLGAPQPVANAIGLLPFTGGNPLERGAQALGGGLGGYAGQQADEALGAPQIPGLGGPLALLGGVGGMMAGGGLARVGETAASNLAVPQLDPLVPQSANFQNPALTLYRGNQTGEPGNWWSASPDYAQTYGGPVQAARLGAHPLETLDATSPQGQAVLADSLIRTQQNLSPQSATALATNMGGTGMAFQPDMYPAVRTDLQGQGYTAMKLGPDWAGGGLRPGENANTYYTLDKGAVTPTAAGNLEPLNSILSRADTVNTDYLHSVAVDRGIDLTGAASKSDVVARLQAAASQPEATTTSGVYPSASQFLNPEHQQGYQQGALDRQLHPEWQTPAASRGPDDTDFNMGYKEGMIGTRPGELINAPYAASQPEFAGAAPEPAAPRGPGNAPSIDQMINMGLTPEMAQAAFDANTTSRVNASMTPAEAIDAQNAAQAAWQRQGGNNPYQPPGGGPPRQTSTTPSGALPGGIDWNPIHNLMSTIGSFTQPLLTGLHLARFAPQEAFRPSVLGNGLKAMGEAFLKGNANEVRAHVNNDFGPNIPDGFRASDMRASSGNPRTNPTAVQKMIDNVPVVGPVLDRFRAVNSALLGTLRDAHYNTSADRLARTDPGANPQMYRDLWREANNATGHQTLVGSPDALNVSSGMGIGWGAMLARAQELGNTVIGSGAPIPGLAAGSRAEAFKTLMGVAGTMAATTALGKTLGAQVNTDQAFNKFGVDTSFLRPVTNNGLFKTVYGNNGAGYDTLIKGAANIGFHLFNGDEKGALDSALAFGRGEFGVLPGAVIDGILGQDWKGDPYSWQDFINEAKTGFMADQHGNLGEGRSIPIAAGENYQAVKAYGPEGLLRALPADIASSVSTTPINTGSQAFKYVVTPDIIAKAGLPSAAQGLDWNEMLPTEKSAITKALPLELAQQIKDNTRSQYPASAAHSDIIDMLRDHKTQAEDRLLDLLNSGQLSGKQVRDGMKAVNADYYDQKAKADANPAYQKESTGFPPATTNAEKALDGYYAIYQHFADDPAKAHTEQQNYLAAMQRSDPALAFRITAATQPQNQTHLEQIYAGAQPLLDKYFGQMGTASERTASRTANPKEDAILTYLGYEPSVKTPEAAAILRQLTGAR